MSGRFSSSGLPGDDDRPMPLHPDELWGDAVSTQELGDALAAARVLESASAGAAVRPSPGFADRVMARLEHEPAPGAAGFLAPLRRFGLGGLAASVRQAWSIVESGSRPLGARATALGYVLAIVVLGTSLTGLAGYGFAGALGLLDPDRSPAPTLPVPTPGPITEPPATPEVTASPTIEPTAEPSPSAPGSEEPTESVTPTASDDDGPGPTPHQSDDDDDDRTPRPSRTPKPSETPKESEGD